MSKKTNFPVALTIAGSDSGGGAGAQADLKTFAALGVHGVCALTCVTAQNPDGVAAIHACPPEIVRAQLDAVVAGFRVRAAKTGMLYSADIIRAVADFLRKHSGMKLVVDPVMVATSGKILLKPDAIGILKKYLLPLAALVTPNLDEATVLTGEPLSSAEDMRAAARRIHGEFGCAVLVKGGHLEGGREAVDIFFDGRDELLLSAPFVNGVRNHGTGCATSAAITAGLALGLDLADSVTQAKNYVTRAIAGSRRVGRHRVLNHFGQ